LLKRLFRLSAFKLALLIGFGFASIHFVWRASHPEVFPFPELDLLEAKALDIKFRRRGPIASSGLVVIAGIDEASIQRHGLWPWKRERVARALKNLNDAGALAVGVDIAFSDPDRSSPHLTVNRVVDELVIKLAANRAGEGLVKSLVSAKLGDPDLAFADQIRMSPRVVLGIMGLKGEDLARVSPEVRRRDELAIARFSLGQIFDPQAIVAGPGGLPRRDWHPAASEKIRFSRNLRAIESVQAPLPVIASAVHHLGLIDAEQDGDGAMRHYALLTRLGDRFVPSLALATAAVALDAEIAPLMSSVHSGGLDGVGLYRGDKDGGLRREIPLDPWTGLHLVNYPGAALDAVRGRPLYDRLSFADATDGSFDPVRVRGKVVLVGATATGTFDQRVTPFDSFLPGVYTHAAVVDSILSGNLFVQTSGVAVCEIALVLAMAILFGLFVPRFRTFAQVGFMIAMALAYVALDFGLFRRGLVLTSVTPLLEMVSLCFGTIFYNYVTVDREKRQIRTAFQHYLTQSVMEEMLKHPEKLKLGGDKRDLTVLFSDIRGFTTISERLPPEELVRTLNEYLTPMTDLVFKHQGTLDKYMGDAIMAIWGAPLPQEDHAFKACQAAVEMLSRLAELRQRWREQGRPDITVGIGINSGPMSVGNMGSDMRFDYTVMGDNVNLGSRLEGANKAYGTQIIISEFTFARVRGKVVARELGSVRVKGRKKPVGIHELRGIGQPTASDAATLAAFEQGLAAYRSQSWDEAEACFRKVAEAWADDGPSIHYLEDVARKRLEPPGDGWDGIYEMKTK
jgi:adenylate cyclase